MAVAPQPEQRSKILLRPMSAQLPGGAESVKKEESRRSAIMEPVLRLPEKRAARQVERIPFRTGAEEWAHATGDESRPSPFVSKPGQSGESRRRSSRKQRARRRIYWAAGVFALLAFFWAGVLWSGRRENVMETSQVNLEALGMSVRSMDEAVEAMHLGNFAEARLLAADARRAHPEIAGSYLIEGEAALAEEGLDPDSRHALVEQAISEGHLSGRARQLQANHLLRGDRDEQVAPGKRPEMALEALRAGMQEDPVAHEPRVRAGEMHSRFPQTLPRAQEAFSEALYRLQPWQSSTVIQAKMQVTVDEVGRKLVLPGGEEFQAPRTPQGSALAAVRRAVRAGADPVEALRELQRFVPESMFAEILNDPSLLSSVTPPTLEVAQKTQPSMLPHASVKAPATTE